MSHYHKNTLTFPYLTAFDIRWTGRNVFGFTSNEIWKIVDILKMEGVVPTAFNVDTLFPQYEASAADVMIAVGLFLMVKEGKSPAYFQTNHEFDAIVRLYQNTDLRLLKHSNN